MPLLGRPRPLRRGAGEAPHRAQVGRDHGPQEGEDGPRPPPRHPHRGGFHQGAGEADSQDGASHLQDEVTRFCGLYPTRLCRQ